MAEPSKKFSLVRGGKSGYKKLTTEISSGFSKIKGKFTEVGNWLTEKTNNHSNNKLYIHLEADDDGKFCCPLCRRKFEHEGDSFEIEGIFEKDMSKPKHINDDDRRRYKNVATVVGKTW